MDLEELYGGNEVADGSIWSFVSLVHIGIFTSCNFFTDTVLARPKKGNKWVKILKLVNNWILQNCFWKMMVVMDKYGHY